MAKTGIGVWRNGTVTSMTVRTSPQESSELRWRRILRKVWLEWDNDRDALMVIEQIPLGDKGTSNLLLERAGLIALLRYGAEARHIPRVLINVGTLKKYATGDGRAPKEQMLTAARTHILSTCANDDEADGLWLAHMALDHYRDAGTNGSLSKVDWPLWTPGRWDAR